MIQRSRLSDYARSVARVWVAFMLLYILYAVTVWLASLFNNSPWTLFVVVSGLAVAIGAILEFIRRGKV